MSFSPGDRGGTIEGYAGFPVTSKVPKGREMTRIKYLLYQHGSGRNQPHSSAERAF
jgi:hypothetical protein